MIRSMTGFAAAGQEEAGTRVNVTIKAVNHRFLDVALKAPHALAALEGGLKALVQEHATRGRVEISVFVESTSAPEPEVTVNHALLARLAAALDEAREAGLITGGLTASDVLRLPQAIEISTRAADREPGVVDPALAALVHRVVTEALSALIAMRATEGAILERDVRARLSTMAGYVDELERQAAAGQARLAERLRDRLAELPSDLQADPAAAAQEIARFVARSDIDEELVRLRGHLEHWAALAAGADPCGRKLDFLVQEMNREVNTIGAKVEGPQVTETVIAAKAELERIREQIQNVE